MNLFRKKDIAHLAQDAEKSGFVRNLTAFDLVFLGIGSVIGTGIFVLTGVGAALYAGPGIAISFILASVACAFAGLATRNIPQWYQYLEVHMLIHTLH